MMSVEFGGTVTRVWYRLYSSVDDPRSYEPAGSSAVTVSVVPRIQGSPVPPPPVAVPPLLSLLPPHAARARASAPAPATATSLCRITSHPLVVFRCATPGPTPTGRVRPQNIVPARGRVHHRPPPARSRSRNDCPGPRPGKRLRRAARTRRKAPPGS